MLLKPSETPLPVPIFHENFSEIVLSEIRPVAVTEEKLRVGDFPKQEVTEPVLASGANEEVHVTILRTGVARLGHEPGELFGRCGQAPPETSCGFHDDGLGGVVNGKPEAQPCSGNRRALRCADCFEE